MSDYIVSPILSATPFVGAYRDKPHPQNGELWLHSAEHGFGFCVAEIATPFKPIVNGSVVRLHISLAFLDGFVPYPIDEATEISVLADRLLGRLFKAQVGSPEFIRAVLERDMLLEDGVIDSDVVDEYDPFLMNLPGNVYYRVVEV